MRVKTKNEKWSTIYFILDLEHKVPAVKIGSTSVSVEQRLSSIQTGNPADLKLLGFTEGYESDFHERFKKYHIRGEWFEWEPIRHAIAEIDLDIPDFYLEYFRRTLTRSAYKSQYKTGKIKREIMLEIVKLYKDNAFLKKALFKLFSGEYAKEKISGVKFCEEDYEGKNRRGNFFGQVL